MHRLDNAQEIFDHVSKHLLGQAATSRRPTIHPYALGSSAYKGKDGRECAVGCMINNRIYRTHIEGLPVTHMDVRASLHLSQVNTSDRNIALMRALQVIHDTKPPAEWKVSLAKFAALRGLNTDHERDEAEAHETT